MVRNLLFFALFAALTACGTTDDIAVGEPSDRTTYPEGPYGRVQGAVIEDLSFVGIDGAPHSLGDVFADEENRVLLLASAAGWCQPCIQEQPQLSALHREFADRGLVVMGAVFENENFETATVDYVKRWRERHDLPYTLVADTPFALRPYFASGDATPPLNILVRVDDMEILLVTTEFQERVMRSLIERNLPK